MENKFKIINDPNEKYILLKEFLIDYYKGDYLDEQEFFFTSITHLASFMISKDENELLNKLVDKGKY